MTKIVDLSKTIQYNKEDPWFMRIKVKNKRHEKSRFLIRYFLGLPSRLFPDDFAGWADDKIVGMGVHATTHIDAPWHYSPTVQGIKSKTIDEVPLEWLYGPGVVLDMSHKKDFDPVTVADLEKEVKDKGIDLKPGTIVLIKTGRDKLKGEDYVNKGTGMSKEATLWLIEKGIKVMGIDQWGWDLPLRHMVKKSKEANEKLFWEGHLVGQEYEYLHMEQLVNLDALPPSGFKIAVFPLKVKGASAAPARVVAIFDDENPKSQKTNPSK